MTRMLLVLTLLVSTLASALAGIVSTPLPVGTFHLFSVPGVINISGVGTFFLCTSTTTAPQNVTVEIFDKDGAANGSATLAVGAEKSVMIGTRAAAGISIDSNAASLNMTIGSARTLSTVNNKLLCSAFVADALSAPPVSMTYLTIVAKLKQKAAN